MILHHRGFPIRKSADRSLFAAPRSLSQLVTSFFGSLCQGIHLMLLFAWTFLFLSLVLLYELLEFHKTNNFVWLSILCEKVLSFLLWIVFSTFRWNCNLPKFGKTFWFFANLLVKSLCPLICSFLTLQYFIRFSMNIYASTDFIIGCFVRTRFIDLGGPNFGPGGLKWTRTTDLALIRRAL